VMCFAFLGMINFGVQENQDFIDTDDTDFDKDKKDSVSDEMSNEEKKKLVDLLSKEGQPGWFRKVTQMVSIAIRQ